MNVEKFVFFDDSYKELSESAFVVDIGYIATETDVMSVYYEKLHFPDYFGFNWDALYDCLLDLSWMEIKDVLIIHKELPSLSRKDFIIYLGILYDTCLGWEKSINKLSLRIYFRKEDKEYITKLLKHIKITQ